MDADTDQINQARKEMSLLDLVAINFFHCGMYALSDKRGMQLWRKFAVVMTISDGTIFLLLVLNVAATGVLRSNTSSLRSRRCARPCYKPDI